MRQIDSIFCSSCAILSLSHIPDHIYICRLRNPPLKLGPRHMYRSPLPLPFTNSSTGHNSPLQGPFSTRSPLPPPFVSVCACVCAAAVVCVCMRVCVCYPHFYWLYPHYYWCYLTTAGPTPTKTGIVHVLVLVCVCVCVCVCVSLVDPCQFSKMFLL
jgi:hypothetical protein